MVAAGHAFTASDLANRRRDVLNASRGGVAFVRDTDGAMFAMMPAEVVTFRAKLEAFNQTLRGLIASLNEDSPHPASLGQVAFASGWSQDRRRQLVADIAEAISVAESIQDPAPVAGLIEMSRPRKAEHHTPFDASIAFAGLSTEDQAVLAGVRRPAARKRSAKAAG